MPSGRINSTRRRRLKKVLFEAQNHRCAICHAYHFERDLRLVRRSDTLDRYHLVCENCQLNIAKIRLLAKKELEADG